MVGVVERTTRFDVTPWSLSLPLLAVVGCGPQVGGSGGSDPSDSTAGDETANETEPTTCESSNDCPNGHACYSGVCSPYCQGCSCAHLRPDADRFRCPGGYYDCYSDDQCGVDEVCSAGDCVPIPMPDPEPCSLQVFDAPLSLTFTEPGAISKVFFASSGNALDELYAVRDDDVVRPAVDGEVVLFTTTAPIVDAIAHDLGNDGARDFVVSLGTEAPSVSAWLGSDKGYQQVPWATGVPGIAIELAIGDWQGDGIADLFLRTAEAVYRAPLLDDGTLGEAEQLASTSDRILVTDVDLMGGSELLVGNAGRFELLSVDDSRVLQALEPDALLVGALVADLDGDEIPEMLAVSDPMRVTTWRGSLLEVLEPTTADLEGRAVAVASGSIGLTSPRDVIVARDDGLATIYYGGPFDQLVEGQPFSCTGEVMLGMVATGITVGDFDQDGDRDLAATDGTNVIVVPQ